MTHPQTLDYHASNAKPEIITPFAPNPRLSGIPEVKSQTFTPAKHETIRHSKFCRRVTRHLPSTSYVRLEHSQARELANRTDKSQIIFASLDASTSYPSTKSYEQLFICSCLPALERSQVRELAYAGVKSQSVFASSTY